MITDWILTNVIAIGSIPFYLALFIIGAMVGYYEKCYKSVTRNHDYCPELKTLTWVVIILALVFCPVWLPYVPNWSTLACGVGLYTLIGLVYAYFRWVRKLKTIIEVYKGHVSDKALESRCSVDDETNRSSIYFWLGYWPLSAVFDLCSGFVYSIEFIFNQFSGIFKRAAERALNKVK